MLKHSYIYLLLFGLFFNSGMSACAQRFVAFHVDSTRCVGDTLRLRVGYGMDCDVRVADAPASISRPQRTFLPDGLVCDSSEGSCTYRSPIRFSAFARNSLVSSANDIDFVRVNMEHSWHTDLLVALECPNGQYAALMYPRHDLSNSCGDHKFDSVPSLESLAGILGLYNPSASMGVPVDLSSGCDSSSFMNAPGIGWNYCWSSSPNHAYAPGDGTVYSSQNYLFIATNGPFIDSTHLSANANFYRPIGSFDSLIGCPVNGTWNLVVQDNWPSDNGWLFDWELSFAGDMLTPSTLEHAEMGGYGVSPLPQDSAFVLLPPGVDTTIVYWLRLLFSSGDTLDTTFALHWTLPYYVSIADTLCQGDTARWNSLAFTSDTLYRTEGLTRWGCDSIVELSYGFMPSYSLHDTLPFCANEPFLYEGVDYGGPATIVVPHQSQYGCDSTVTVHLIMIDSAFRLQLQMSLDGQEWVSDTTLYGCNPLTVYFRDTTLFEQWRQWTFGDGDTLFEQVSSFRQVRPFAHVYDSVGSFFLTLTAESIHGCVDSAVLRKDGVRVLQSPEASFRWEPAEVVSHNPLVQLWNDSRPTGDSLRFMWHIADGEGGEDTTSEVSPFYRWPVGDGDRVVLLEAIWPHVLGDSLVVTCIDSSEQTIVIVNEYLQFPNVVSPNGDGVNDRWEVVNLLECGLYSMNELWIYNRWGNLVYHVENIWRQDQFWNPNEPFCPDGTYYYRFSAKSNYGIVRRNGTIEVVR